MSNNMLTTSELFSKGYGFSPKMVMVDTNLTVEAKAIYSYLSSFSGAGMSSYPSTDIMLHHLNMSKNRYLKHRKLLEDNGYLIIERKKIDNLLSKNIYILSQEPSKHTRCIQNRAIENRELENRELENEPTNSNSFKSNNINSNSNNKKILSSSDEQDDVPYKEIVDYLNLKTSKSYKHSTSKTKSLIKARWNEGFRVDDFKKAIDNKCFEWIGNSDMAKYLRPETLFGTKFEGYLNENNVNQNMTNNFENIDSEWVR